MEPVLWLEGLPVPGASVWLEPPARLDSPAWLEPSLEAAPWLEPSLALDAAGLLNDAWACAWGEACAGSTWVLASSSASGVAGWWSPAATGAGTCVPESEVGALLCPAGAAVVAVAADAVGAPSAGVLAVAPAAG
jgi:hypothetical protein